MSHNVWMEFKKPEHTAGRIRRAGKAIASGSATREHESIAQDWRDAHLYVLNTFQGTLRRWIKGRDAVLVQRLKRLSTVKDKLVTGRATDLYSLNDLAGCRLIFGDVEQLHDYREEFKSKSRSGHKYISSGKYDYIASPKATGYRGIHDVYSYHVGSSPGNAWNGLRIEIQYRTLAQHAWATAVEISDIIDNARVKFDKGQNEDRELFFKLASEHIARSQEGMVGPLPDYSDEQIVSKMDSLEGAIGVLARLKSVSSSDVDIPASKNLVLAFHEKLEVKGFRSARLALEYRNKMEIEQPNVDVVYVRTEKPNEIASAFRNYFRDAAEFLRLMK